METARNELQRGWREARWSFYFSIALLPCVVIAVLLAYVIEGPPALEPSGLTWAFCVPATLLALLWAGFKDGFESALGRWVWTATILLIVTVLVRQMIRADEEKRDADLKIGENEYRLTVTAHVVKDVPNRRLPRTGNVHWELSSPGHA